MAEKNCGIGICRVCGKPFVKKTYPGKYCSKECAYAVVKEYNREQMRRQKLERQRAKEIASRKYEPIESIEEKARAAGMSYGQYVALQKEGCDVHGRCEVDQTCHRLTG